MSKIMKVPCRILSWVTSVFGGEGQKAVGPREGQCFHRIDMKEHAMSTCNAKGTS